MQLVHIDGVSEFPDYSTIHGHHVSKTVWTPIVGEVSSLNPESGNSHDRFAMLFAWCLVKSLKFSSTSCNTMELFLLMSLDTEELVVD